MGVGKDLDIKTENPNPFSFKGPTEKELRSETEFHVKDLLQLCK